jgi:hypothetical protein
VFLENWTTSCEEIIEVHRVQREGISCIVPTASIENVDERGQARG